MMSKNNTRLFVVFFLITWTLFTSPTIEKPASASGDKWFVSENGTGTDCSRTNPGPLQYCVEQKAQSGDTVYVGEGFYVADDPSDDNLLLIEKSIHLIGSCTWDATGPVTCALPTRSSRLNGEYERRVIAIVGPGISVTIEGFQIYQGNAHKKPPSAGQFVIGAGGGIYAQDLDQLVLRNNYIFTNKASDSTSLALRFAFGGGIFVTGVKRVDILSNDFYFNTTSSKTAVEPIYGKGGGIHIRSCGIVNIELNDISGNSVANEHGIGAGLFLINIDNLNLNENLFTYQNSLSIEQFFIDGSALELYNVNALSINRNIFSNNYGYSTIESFNLIGEFTSNKIFNNPVWIDFIIYSEAKTTNVKIINNFFGENFGWSSIHIDSIHPSTFPEVDIIHNTFALGNEAIKAIECKVNIHRNVFTNFIGTVIDLDSISTTYEINENLFWSTPTIGETGVTFWEADPMLVDPSNGDLHIRPDSAAINKVSGGTITTDIDGDPRPIGLGVDLGADEYGAFIFMPLILH